MKCELCKNDIEEFDLVVPVGKVALYLVPEIIPLSRGIHLECLKEVVESVRSIGLTISGQRFTIEAPNLEGPEDA